VQAYPAETSEAFCAGHVAAFDFFGKVPQSILYDGTRIAVARLKELVALAGLLVLRCRAAYPALGLSGTTLPPSAGLPRMAAAMRPEMMSDAARSGSVLRCA